MINRAWMLIGIGILSVGCQPGSETVTVDSSAIRSAVLVTEQPESLLSLAEAYAEFQGDGEMTVVGRIFADGMDPFDPEKASFSVIEVPKPGHKHDDPGDCPFCKREMENAATGIVQILGEDGSPVAGSARDLLKLKKNDDIVATGQVEMVGDLLIINASSIHVLSESAAEEYARTVVERVKKAGGGPSTDSDLETDDVAPAPFLPPQETMMSPATGSEGDGSSTTVSSSEPESTDDA
ncbi:MAG: hypothetical protein ACE361_03635 [Aureliella sp.]